MTALIGIPDLGLIAWIFIALIFATDAGIFYLAYLAERNEKRREDYRQELAAEVHPPRYRAIGSEPVQRGRG